MKRCNSCNIIKKLSKFSKQKSRKDGLQLSCKECDKIRSHLYFRTKDGLVSKIYSNQKVNSKTRGHVPPCYSKQDLQDWLYSQKKFHHLFHIWEIGNFDRMLVPSVDRMDDYEPYSFSNIQLMTWRENEAKGNIDRVEGRNNKKNKTDLQYSKDGDFITAHHSTCGASRQSNISQKNISACCTGKRKSAGGFYWEYPLITTRTAKVITMMHSEVKKQERKDNK